MRRLWLIALAVALWVVGIDLRPATADDLTRTVLMKKDLAGVPGKEVRIFITQYKPGGKSGKHYHPGQEFIHVESDPSNPAYIHEATDLGTSEGMKLLVVLITEKGQPLAYPAK